MQAASPVAGIDDAAEEIVAVRATGGTARQVKRVIYAVGVEVLRSHEIELASDVVEMKGFLLPL